MNLDYLDAHERHWEDAELLKRKIRLANADQLYGMSAECGLKRLMIDFDIVRLRPHQRGADNVRVLINKAKLDGII